jgi:hypothetical protein
MNIPLRKSEFVYTLIDFFRFWHLSVINALLNKEPINPVTHYYIVCTISVDDIIGN